jgi:biotin transport system ATP-binding protein
MHIEFKAVTVRAAGNMLLENLTVSLREHRIAVIGANGSGKSTMARLMNALLLPSEGEVLISGASTADDARTARRRVGLVFQNPEHQIVMPTVEEDMAFGLKNLGLRPGDIAEKVKAALARHGLLDKRESPAHLLSGGEKKLLSVLSVLVMEPETVVVDEPLASLDLANRRRILALLDSLPQQLIAMTHDLDTIAAFDRALLLHRGRLIADGRPAEVIARYLEVLDGCSAFMSPAQRQFTAHPQA